MEPKAFGKYQVVEKIGEGGFGEVYRGRDPNLKRRVAIKTCKSANPELLDRFVREAEIAARLQHPNIVTVFDFGYQGRTPYIVQEYLTGEDLDRKIRRRQPADPAVKIDYLRQVALGLRHAHLQGVIHRDVKPANVRVLHGGLVKIMDFGIAKLLSAEVDLTRTGITLGSARYLPPEQFHGEKVDLRADVFSLGVTAYELLTCECPFDGETVARIFYRITQEDPRPIDELWPACPPRLARCVMTCLQKDPTHRYSDLAPVIAELEAHLGGSAGSAALTGSLPSPAGDPPGAPAAGAAPPSAASFDAIPPPPPPLAATTPLPLASSGTSATGGSSGSFLGRTYEIALRRPWAARAAIFALVALGAFAATYLVSRSWRGATAPAAGVAEVETARPPVAGPAPPPDGEPGTSSDGTSSGDARGPDAGEIEPPPPPPPPPAESPPPGPPPAESPPPAVEPTIFEPPVQGPAAGEPEIGATPGDAVAAGPVEPPAAEPAIAAPPRDEPADLGTVAAEPPAAAESPAATEPAEVPPPQVAPPPPALAPPPPPPRVAPPPPTTPPPAVVVRRGVTLYQGRDFEGRNETLFTDDPDLRDNPIGNDTVSSARVDPGCRVWLFQHGDYGGKVTVVTGDVGRLRGTEVGNDEVSSLRISCDDAPGASAAPPPAGPRGAVLYRGANFTGVDERFQGNDPNLANNAVGAAAVSSVRVSPGCQVLLYSKENYQGKETMLTRDAPDLRGTEVGDDQASSVQVVCRRR